MVELIEKYFNIVILVVGAAGGWVGQLLFFKYRKSEERSKYVGNELDTIDRLLKTVKELANELDDLHNVHNDLKIKLMQTEAILTTKDEVIRQLTQDVEKLRAKWNQKN